MDKIKDEILENVKESNIINLLRPLSNTIFEQEFNKYQITIIQPQIQQIILVCNNIIENANNKRLEEELKRIEEEKYPIKPGIYKIIGLAYNGHYLFVADDIQNGDNLVETRSISPSYLHVMYPVEHASYFRITRDSEGYLFYNTSYCMYLFLSGDIINGDRALEARFSLQSRSYFEIHKKNLGYVIKHKTYGEYLFISGDLRSGNRIVEGRNYIEDRSYFRFQKCD